MDLAGCRTVAVGEQLEVSAAGAHGRDDEREALAEKRLEVLAAHEIEERAVEIAFAPQSRGRIIGFRRRRW